MEEVSIELENCFGIGKFNHKFYFSNNGDDSKCHNLILIYASNGTMKTSFAKTLDLISKDDKKELPRDMINEDKRATYIIKSNGENINPIEILVINSENYEYDKTEKISTFLASKELKAKYDKVYKDLQIKENDYIKKLKSVSQSSDCKKEILGVFQEDSSTNFLEVLVKLAPKLLDKHTEYDFKYNDIFDKDKKVKKFLEDNKDLINEYFTQYNNLITKSNFFSSANTDNPFGTYQANELLISINNNAYFEAGHKLKLKEREEIINSSELKKIYEEEISNILSDTKLKKTFESIDKKVSANAELRIFKSVITKNNSILIKLQDYESFRIELWINYLSEIKSDTLELVNFYGKVKEDLNNIINEAKKEVTTWEDIIKIFNMRFHVPFEAKLKNREDVILREQTANLSFVYKEDNNTKQVSKDELMKVLSRGEKRAFFILQILFEIEARKTNNQNTLLVLDDISESFDYKNKFAIIEYIKDLTKLNIFKIIVLTHNFDFYRTLSSRLNLSWDNTYMVIKKSNNEIELKKGQYRNNLLKYFLKNIKQDKVFISIIPFLRNIIEYLEMSNNPQDNSNNYDLLTACLHIKKVTKDISHKDVLDLYEKYFPNINFNTVQRLDTNIKEFIFETAERIMSEENIDEIKIENKITLSIAIRLKAEEYMTNMLGYDVLDNINKNQTNELLDKYLIEYGKLNDEKNNIELLERVNLMTPENIHINSFMFEPLIDMSVIHLIDLYKEISNLHFSSK